MIKSNKTRRGIRGKKRPHAGWLATQLTAHSFGPLLEVPPRVLYPASRSNQQVWRSPGPPWTAEGDGRAQSKTPLQREGRPRRYPTAGCTCRSPVPGASPTAQGGAPRRGPAPLLSLREEPSPWPPGHPRLTEPNSSRRQRAPPEKPQAGRGLQAGRGG